MRHPVRVCLAAAVAVAGLWAPAASAAVPQAVPSEATAAKASAVVRTATVTLVTGDRVTATTTADGKTAYSAVPAEGSAPGTFLSRTDVGGDSYFYPTDVIGKVGTVLDRELFNVSALIRDGYDDAHRASLPLIVQDSSAATPQVLTGSGPLTRKRTFTSLRAHAAVLDKKQAGDFGDDIDQGLGGVKKIWLDGKTKADALDRNLTQINAPQAWAAGASGAGVKLAVLDTGADPTHPDLAGRISESADFTGTGSSVDGHGHGTHVAATVAGSGAGAPGERSGVAPKADLLVGKVLDNSGSGTDSQVIAGMEWAVAQGARVISMSLGSGPTDGTDPVSTSLEKLSEDSGALFVVAAGNAGPGVGTVGAPSVAPAALSVAAVDYSNATASFSSRGPALAAGVVKPEIAAPGVNIVAARAAGTNLGTVQTNPDYTALSGTSMATPQVAGAAALVAEEHPDWKAGQIKSALMGSAAKLTSSVYETGAGLTDAAAALKQSVVSDTTAADFGRMDGAGTSTRTVTFTNTSSSATTLDLAGALTRSDGVPPAGMTTVSPAKLDLAAGASGTATVTVDTTGTPTGTYSGTLTATPAGGQALRIPMVLDRATTVTVKAIGRDGTPAMADMTMINTDNGTVVQTGIGATGTRDVRVPDGRYMALATVRFKIDGVPAVAMMTLDRKADQNEIVFDARTTRPWTASVQGFKTRNELLIGNLGRFMPNGSLFINHSMLAGGAYGTFGDQAIWVSPTENVEPDTVQVAEHRRLVNADSDITKGDASTLFDLTFSDATVPATGPWHQLSRKDVTKLAKVRATYKAFNGDYRQQEGTTVYGDDIYGLNMTTPSYVAVPRVRTEYISAEGRTWAKLNYRRTLHTVMDYDLMYRTFEPGKQSRDTWYTAPYTVRTTGTATGNRLQLTVDDAVDAQGRKAQYSDFTYPRTWTPTTSLYRDGSLVTEGPGSSIDKTFTGSGAADYRLERTFASGEAFPIGGEAKGTWTFRTDGSATAAPANLLNVTFDAGLDNYNRARADRPLLLSAKVSGAHGKLSKVKAYVTSDGGTTWHQVLVCCGINGTYHFIAPHNTLVKGGFLGLRLTAADASGSTVDLGLPRAIPVTAS
ncbi:S8 family serine peptidase [Streptomyces beijiangensis]|uniref:S8 family serine peptidase n=1 Tax=Streptomyces beijiangensis TaxID=163361 RepID=A0A939F4W3_9ACTN|nr:S8 family serine peptidase [Streptomyces beijiangensis]MBO0511703.1 S8 family serine peptidase [Streptomyces beijiangensis]